LSEGRWKRRGKPDITLGAGWVVGTAPRGDVRHIFGVSVPRVSHGRVRLPRPPNGQDGRRAGAGRVSRPTFLLWSCWGGWSSRGTPPPPKLAYGGVCSHKLCVSRAGLNRRGRRHGCFAFANGGAGLLRWAHFGPNSLKLKTLSGRSARHDRDPRRCFLCCWAPSYGPKAVRPLLYFPV